MPSADIIHSIQGFREKFSRTHGKLSESDFEYFLRDLNYLEEIAKHDRRLTVDENRRIIFQSVTASSQATLRVMLLINGGAAVALLAFIGSVTLEKEATAALASAFMLFACGVFFAGMSTAFTFFTHYNDLETYTHRQEQNHDKADDFHGRTLAAKCLSILCGALAFALFLLGCSQSLNGL